MREKIANQDLGRISPEQYKKADKRPVVLVLDNVRSLHNVGSVFRTGDAFLVEAIHLCGFTGTPPHREIEKTALGATASVPWKQLKSALESVRQLQQENYTVFAVEQTKNSIALNELTYDGEKIALVFGNEVEGVSQEVIDACDGVIEIPQQGSKHSLNISVAVGVVLWELVRGA